MSPNDIYGALLQFHLQQQQAQQMINPQELFMQSLSDPSKIQSQLHQYQLMKRAAQVTAAQQLMSKANQQDAYCNKYNSTSNQHQMNSPASSTSSSTTTDSIQQPSIEDLLNLEENIRGSQRREELLKTIAAAAAVSSGNKRPYLKFSMDAILGNGDAKSAKRLCHGLNHNIDSEATGSSSPKNAGSDETPSNGHLYNNSHRIQLNYNGLNAGNSSSRSSSSSSQRPSPTTSNSNNELMAESKMSSQQHQLAMAAAVVANSGKSGQVQFPLSMGKSKLIKLLKSFKSRNLFYSNGSEQNRETRARIFDQKIIRLFF